MNDADHCYRRPLRRHCSFLALAAASILWGQAVAMAGDLSLPGPWRVQSLSIRGDDGKVLELPDRGNPTTNRRGYNVLVAETTFTLRAGDEVLSEYSYVCDSTQSPATIDMTSKDGKMLGIYKSKGTRLEISLNDAAKGRPHDFDREKNGLVLVLNGFRNWRLYVADTDGGHRRLLLPNIDLVRCLLPKWSPDGKRIAVMAARRLIKADGDMSHVFVVDVDSGATKDLGPGDGPAWSPDGKRIAFHTAARLFEQEWDRWDPSPHVFIVDADGGAPKDLGPGRLPNWSPDGQWIALVDPAGGSSWTMRTDGSQREMIAPGSRKVSWSPNGDRLAYGVRESGTENICVKDCKTKQSRMLLPRRYQQLRGPLTWSPDGQWICFLAYLPPASAAPEDQRLKCEFAVVHAEGHAKGFRVLVAQEDMRDRFTDGATWDRDGKRILVAFQMKKETGWQLCFVDPEGKLPLRPATGQYPGGNSIAPAWSPDRKRAAWTQNH